MKKLRDPDGNCRLLKSVRTTYFNISSLAPRVGKMRDPGNEVV